MVKVIIKIGVENIKFNKKPTQWLNIWLDSYLNFSLHMNKKVKKTQVAKIQVKRLIQLYELATAPIQKIQIAIIQFIILYKAEPW